MTVQGTVKVAHLGNFQHSTLPYGEDPANGYFVAFVVNESSKGDGFGFGGTLDFYVVVKGIHYASDNGHVLTGRADAELLPVTLNAGEHARHRDIRSAEHARSALLLAGLPTRHSNGGLDLLTAKTLGAKGSAPPG